MMVNDGKLVQMYCGHPGISGFQEISFRFVVCYSQSVDNVLFIKWHSRCQPIKMSYAYSGDAIPLLNYIEKIVPLDNPTVEIILDNCREVLIPKGQMIFNEGQIAKYVYFIVSGKAWSFYTDDAGKTITWSFHFNEVQSAFNNLFIVDYKSFLTQTPGTMSIEALTDIRALRIGRRAFDAQVEQVPILEKCLRKLNEYSFIVAYDRIFTLLTMSATDRYNKLLNNEPYLIQMFNDKYLASYIGVEPQSLSRIRRNIRFGPAQLQTKPSGS
jgi:CRP/FNR family transcriptional regulator, anaerobic regulatory protein